MHGIVHLDESLYLCITQNEKGKDKPKPVEITIMTRSIDGTLLVLVLYVETNQNES